MKCDHRDVSLFTLFEMEYCMLGVFKRESGKYYSMKRRSLKYTLFLYLPNENEIKIHTCIHTIKSTVAIDKMHLNCLF